jgi:hypothetical protein
VLNSLRAALEAASREGLIFAGAAPKIQLMFQSQSELDEELQRSFPRAVFVHNSTLMETVCHFLTSDIFITSGSSFAVVAAFAQPLQPLIVEERRQDNPSRNESNLQHHMFSGDEALLMEDGDFLLSEKAIKQRIVDAFKF